MIPIKYGERLYSNIRGGAFGRSCQRCIVRAPRPLGHQVSRGLGCVNYIVTQLLPGEPLVSETYKTPGGGTKGIPGKPGVAPTPPQPPCPPKMKPIPPSAPPSPSVKPAPSPIKVKQKPK